MAKFMKKPVEIDAWLFDLEKIYDEKCKNDVPEWIFNAIEKGNIFCKIDFSLKGKLKNMVKTLEGEHIISDGDYLIKGIKGELYPCKPDVFEMTYWKKEDVPEEIMRMLEE